MDEKYQKICQNCGHERIFHNWIGGEYICKEGCKCTLFTPPPIKFDGVYHCGYCEKTFRIPGGQAEYLEHQKQCKLDHPLVGYIAPVGHIDLKTPPEDEELIKQVATIITDFYYPVIHRSGMDLSPLAKRIVSIIQTREIEIMQAEKKQRDMVIADLKRQLTGIQQETLKDVLLLFNRGYFPIPEGGMQCTDCIKELEQEIIMNFGLKEK